MKAFLAIYIGTQNARRRSKWDELDEAERKKREQPGSETWMERGRANGAAIVDHGAPLGRTKRVSAAGIEDIRNAMTAYAIVRAESHEAAARIIRTSRSSTATPWTSWSARRCPSERAPDA